MYSYRHLVYMCIEIHLFMFTRINIYKYICLNIYVCIHLYILFHMCICIFTITGNSIVVYELYKRIAIWVGIS